MHDNHDGEALVSVLLRETTSSSGNSTPAQDVREDSIGSDKKVFDHSIQDADDDYESSLDNDVHVNGEDGDDRFIEEFKELRSDIYYSGQRLLSDHLNRLLEVHPNMSEGEEEADKDDQYKKRDDFRKHRIRKRDRHRMEETSKGSTAQPSATLIHKSGITTTLYHQMATIRIATGETH